MRTKIIKLRDKHLEITMRDVLDSLEDAACYMSYRAVVEAIEILSIEPPGRQIHSKQQVTQIAAKLNANIVDYLITRELKKSA